jgi:hypothetical protein
MNGTHIINRMHDNEKRYVRGLTEYMADRWEMNLSDLTALEGLDKKLLDIGIIYPVDSNLVGFTSCVILRVCIDALFPTPSRPTLDGRVYHEIPTPTIPTVHNPDTTIPTIPKSRQFKIPTVQNPDSNRILTVQNPDSS